jgi:purine-binding chemotaxis protein CheW
MNGNLARDEYITVRIGGQMFGLPISRVQDLFVPERMTQVPLAAHEIAGLLNLRGRVLTVIDMRTRLRLESRQDDRPCGKAGGVSPGANGAPRRRVALTIEHKDEPYGLLVDEVGEVVKLPAASRDPNPVNMEPRLAHVSTGVHHLEGWLVIALDVDRLLDFDLRHDPVKTAA